ncbi:MAG: winged helix-turn-helix domain-containing protein [Nanoarchaeota archaeon]|nr:winged helix-turn-helix domain-containing protein [Nanoarchaeota archaeon]MBU4456347.1 winged helix-turn-helix domain-containing protein [Nanoarchaeota archaeon]MCG2719285.1 winged helix-turn-helix domain-containing protein [Nanoarchaeota archaeon]
MKSAKQKERELIIKLHNEKNSTYEIARILGISQTKASFWARRYRKTGSLEDIPRSGRPTPLNKATLKSIAEAIKSQITQAKGKAGVTSKEVLALIDAKIQKKYSLRHAERILHKVGFSLITPRVSHIRKDEKAQAKFRGEFKKKPNRNIWDIQ